MLRSIWNPFRIDCDRIKDRRFNKNVRRNKKAPHLIRGCGAFFVESWIWRAFAIRQPFGLVKIYGRASTSSALTVFSGRVRDKLEKVANSGHAHPHQNNPLVLSLSKDGLSVS